MKRFYVRRFATDRWSVWDRITDEQIVLATTKRRAQDAVNALNYIDSRTDEDREILDDVARFEEREAGSNL